MNPKFDTYVGVFLKDGVKFVTGINKHEALWESGKAAMKMSEQMAKDIVFGLTLNLYPSAVMKVLHGVELSNPEEE